MLIHQEFLDSSFTETCKKNTVFLLQDNMGWLIDLQIIILVVKSSFKNTYMCLQPLYSVLLTIY